MTVLANAHTGIQWPDVFYFGNAIGESGNSATDAKVNAFDMLGARENQRNFLDPAPIDFPFDFNRDARVNAIDMLIARDNSTHFLNALRLITVPGPKVASMNRAEADDPAHDVVLRRTARKETSPTKLTWLHEFEEGTTEDRPSDKHNPSTEPVATLLASL